MARILLVHGAFNEFWGPYELKARWLPALRDGLWHHDVEISDADVGACFYGDLFRREPGTEAEQQLEKSRAGIAELLTNLAGSDVIAALGQAASNAAFDRIVDMVTIIATQPGLRARMRARAETMIDENTRVIVSHSIGTLFSRSIQRWVNVRATGDKAAAVSLREKFGPRVEEFFIDNGHRAHDPEPYLNAAVTGAAIAAALR